MFNVLYPIILNLSLHLAKPTQCACSHYITDACHLHAAVPILSILVMLFFIILFIFYEMYEIKSTGWVFGTDPWCVPTFATDM